MTFAELNLEKSILKKLVELDYTNPTPVQEKTIPTVIDGNDVIVSAETGTGKTASFALPIIDVLIKTVDHSKKRKQIKALVLSPTRELAVQISNNFKIYSKYSNLRTSVVFGGTSIEPQKDILKKGIDILVATPGRLLDLHKQDLVNLDYVETFVLDEADLMLSMGFIDDVKKIERLCPKTKQSLLFSATIPPSIEQLANEILNAPKRIEISKPYTQNNSIEQQLYYVPKPKKNELCLHLLRNTVKGHIIIFRRTKFGVDKLEKTLLKNNYKVDSIHGDKSQTARQTALNRFKNKEVNILIATDVAARGIDIDKLDAVINFDLPNIAETYVHRIGRTGRAGNLGASYSFCSADEKPYAKAIQSLMEGVITIVEDHPYPLDPKAKPEIHKKKGSKYKKGRKSVASKKKKKRWY